MPDALARLTARLLERGDLPASQISTRTWQAWQSMVDAGALSRERRGGGQVVCLHKPALLREWLRQRYPDATGVEANAPARASAVRTFRNAKRARRLSVEPVLLRVFHPVPCQCGDQHFDLQAHARRTGIACVQAGAAPACAFQARVAVVENLEVFLHVERLSLPVDLALYAGGRLSQTVLTWLATPAMASCSFIHCGDYDPVGLDEYLRLRAKVGDRVSLHIPDQLESLMVTYGRPELVRDSATVLRRLRSADCPDVQRIVDLIDRTGCGLEQEVLLLKGIRVRGG
jgi:hypothetical protein